MKAEIPETVLVCLIDERKNYKVDAELPSQMPGSELKTGLLRLLKKNEERLYLNSDSLIIRYNGSVLGDQETLASVGAWDGSELYLDSSYRPWFY